MCLECEQVLATVAVRHGAASVRRGLDWIGQLALQQNWRLSWTAQDVASWEVVLNGTRFALSVLNNQLEVSGLEDQYLGANGLKERDFGLARLTQAVGIGDERVDAEINGYTFSHEVIHADWEVELFFGTPVLEAVT